MMLLPALLIANSLNWSFGRLNRIERRRPLEAREIQEYQPDADSPIPIDASSSTTRDHGSDVGILSTVLKGQDSYTDFYEGSRVLQDQCKDFVQCVDGNEVGTGQLCEVACGNTVNDTFSYGGECCSGEIRFGKTPCFGFTGSVCKDGISCKGGRACASASIFNVVGSCTGRDVCNYAGDGEGGSIEEIISSCKGNDACSEAAYGGSIKSIINSCHGGFACDSAAANGGSIMSMVDACFELSACRNAAVDGGSIEGGITDSCNGHLSCQAAAANRGSIAAITKGCIGEEACSSAAYAGGSIGGIYKACVGTNACQGVSRGSGSIAAITKACKGDRACFFAASGSVSSGPDPDPPDNGSSIGGVVINKACNADEACSRLARVNITIVRNCTGTQVAPFCPNYCPKELRRNFTAFKECTVANECPSAPFSASNCYNCTEGAQQVYPDCPILPYVYYDITDGLEKCCNKESSSKDIRTQDELPDKCTPKEEKNAPFMKDGEGGD